MSITDSMQRSNMDTLVNHFIRDLACYSDIEISNLLNRIKSGKFSIVNGEMFNRFRLNKWRLANSFIDTDISGMLSVPLDESGIVKEVPAAEILYDAINDYCSRIKHVQEYIGQCVEHRYKWVKDRLGIKENFKFVYNLDYEPTDTSVKVPVWVSPQGIKISWYRFSNFNKAYRSIWNRTFVFDNQFILDCANARWVLNTVIHALIANKSYSDIKYFTDSEYNIAFNNNAALSTDYGSVIIDGFDRSYPSDFLTLRSFFHKGSILDLSETGISDPASPCNHDAGVILNNFSIDDVKKEISSLLRE